MGNGRVQFGREKGYGILEIYEIYEYQVTHNSQETGEWGLFVDYRNTFLKLKAEASGYPSWVHYPEDEERHVSSFGRVNGYG